MAKVGRLIAELVKSGAVRRIERPPVELPLATDIAKRLDTKPISDFDVTDFTAIVNAHALKDKKIADRLRLLVGQKGRLTPAVLSKMPGYNDVFTPSGALTQQHAERMFLGTDLSQFDHFSETPAPDVAKDTSVLGFVKNPYKQGLNLILGLMDFFTKKLN